MFYFLNIKFNFFYKNFFFLDKYTLMTYYFKPRSFSELKIFLFFIPRKKKIYWIGLSDYKLFKHIFFFKYFICLADFLKQVNITFFDNGKIFLEVGGLVSYSYLLRFCIKNEIDISIFFSYYFRTLYENFFFYFINFCFNCDNLVKFFFISKTGKFFTSFSKKKNSFNFCIIFFVFDVSKLRRNVFHISLFDYSEIINFYGYKYISLVLYKEMNNYNNHYLVPSVFYEFDSFFFVLSFINISLIINFEFSDLVTIKYLLDYVSCITRRKMNIFFTYDLF